MAFKLKSGNTTSFKQMGSSPAKQKITGENTSEIRKDKRGKDYSLALYDTDAGINKGDTIRPGNAPRVDDYIMGGDNYELKKLGDKNYEIKSPAKQKEENAVYHERIARHIWTKDGKQPNPAVEELKDSPQAKGYTPKHQSHDGYAYQDGVRVEDKKSAVKQKNKSYTNKGKYKVSTNVGEPGWSAKQGGNIKFKNVKSGKTTGYTTDPSGTITKTKGGKSKEISQKKYKRQISRKLNKQTY